MTELAHPTRTEVVAATRALHRAIGLALRLEEHPSTALVSAFSEADAAVRAVSARAVLLEELLDDAVSELANVYAAQDEGAEETPAPEPAFFDAAPTYRRTRAVSRDDQFSFGF
jgi:hypothetical protein